MRTPLPGLLLAGQDVTSPGVQGAFMGGLMAAAAVEPALWGKLGRRRALMPVHASGSTALTVPSAATEVQGLRLRGRGQPGARS